MLLGIICNKKSDDIDSLQAVNHMYLNAVATHMAVQPVLIPAEMDEGTPDVALLLQRLDGLLLTGNRTNLHPSNFGIAPSPAYEPYDRGRDAVALALVKGALAIDLPVLAICRGYQELNVACGGSLMTDIHLQDGRLAHLTPDSDYNTKRFAARHDVHFTEDGYFHKLLGVRSAITNSLHWQAVDRVGENLAIEARAEDGIIEALRHTKARYCVGVQWHPEFQFGENIISAPLFADFERAMRDYADGK